MKIIMIVYAHVHNYYGGIQMKSNIISEANRCLQCKNPRCTKGCPVSTPIKEVIKMLLDGNIQDAGETLFNNNPLSIVCSLVCPHERQCEGHCVLGVKGSPVNFSSIENYISDYYLNIVNPECTKDPNKKVAIIGSGPAGITIAIILAQRGYDITIFEAHDKIGGVMQYGIPEFRLPKKILERIKEKLIGMGIKIRPNILIGPVLTVDDLFRDDYKAVFVGTGVWKPRSLGIKGESLGHVHYAIDYLKNPDAYNLGSSLCVVGAGNVAIDAARTAVRKGIKEVTVLYRGDQSTMSAEKIEIEYAKLDGVKFEFFKTPVQFIDEGVLYNETEYVTDSEGKQKVTVKDTTNKLFKADSIIVAISQGPRDLIISSTTGLYAERNGLLSTDDHGRTSKEGVFASGDVVTGAKTVVEAVRLSKMVADSIDEYVTKKYFS
jgi:glutamate synthase (NADPH) small chain